MSVFTNTTKHTATTSNVTKHVASFTNLSKSGSSAFVLLIGGGFSLNIGSGFNLLVGTNTEAPTASFTNLAKS